MWGRFTALASWREVVALSQLVSRRGGVDEDGGDRDNDAIVAFGAGGPLPVIIWDSEAKVRSLIDMRWGTPDSHDWRRPKLVYARAETIASKEPFRTPFHVGQRGIVVCRTRSEGDNVIPSGETETRTMNPGEAQPRGFALVWRLYDVPDQPTPLRACVMVTVPVNELIRRTVNTREKDPRMPAILEDDAWSTWLGEDNAEPAAAEAVLKTMEGVNWQAAPELKKPRAPRKPS